MVLWASTARARGVTRYEEASLGVDAESPPINFDEKFMMSNNISVPVINQQFLRIKLVKQRWYHTVVDKLFPPKLLSGMTIARVFIDIKLDHKGRACATPLLLHTQQTIEPKERQTHEEG